MRMSTFETIAARAEENEVRSLEAFLDSAFVPRADKGGATLSLLGRVRLMHTELRALQLVGQAGEVRRYARSVVNLFDDPNTKRDHLARRMDDLRDALEREKLAE